MAKILIVDDDVQLTEMISDWLSREGYTVEATHGGIEALALVRSFGFDLIVLDWDMPGMTGPDVAVNLRQRGVKLPIIMLTAKNAIEEKEKGFDSGVDDYLTKPFHPKELSMRVRSVLSRSGSETAPQPAGVQTFGNLEIDKKRSNVSINGEALKLTSKEFGLLEYLLRHRGQVLSAEVLLSAVWPSESDASIAGVRMCISRLREKLTRAESQLQISTISGAGYVLE